MEHPKVSVIVPVYNAEPYLRRCLDSIVNQTLREIEIICVDDGSTDGSGDILRGCGMRDGRVTVLTQPHANAGAARNLGLRCARGEYLSFLDADDFFEPDMLERACACAERHGADIVVFRSNVYDTGTGRFREQRNTIRGELLPKRGAFAADEVRANFFGAFIGWAWDKLFRRDFVLENGLRFQSLRSSNDLAFTFTALAKARRIAVMEEILAHHRTGGGNSLEATRGQSWDNCYLALAALRDNLKSAGLYERFERDYINHCLHFLLWNLSTMTEPARRQMYESLRSVWLRELGVRDYPREKFYSRAEVQLLRMLLHCPYSPAALELLELARGVRKRTGQAVGPKRGKNAAGGESTPGRGGRNGRIRQLRDGGKRLYYAGLSVLSPETVTRVQFFRLNGRMPDLKNPRSFAEKLSWLKLYRYGDDPLVRQCADKLTARDYVRQRGWGGLLNELYAVCDRPEDLDWDSLPDKYVLKWNFGCGFNLLQDGSNTMDRAEMTALLNQWRQIKYWKYYMELQYRDVAPRLLCERFLDAPEGEDLIDYKFYCFSGRTRAILVIGRKAGQAQRAVFMTPDWRFLSEIPKKYPLSFRPPRPSSLEQMRRAAESLAAPFPFVRVDFYEYENRPVFGEMTFTPAAGLNPSECLIDGRTMGDWLALDWQGGERR